ncbi:MAG: hypothetical protein HXY18_15030 [Bryobacteraceae bacterium]|nr:hypothetical protein [Bryobacteraceae bacterium]
MTGQRMPAVASSALLIWASASLYAQPSGAGLLNALRKLDEEAARSLSLTLQVRIPAHPFDLGQGTVSQNCRVSSDSGAHAINCENANPEKPIYRPPESVGYDRVDYDRNDNLILWREVRRFAFSSPALNGVRVQLEMLAVDKAGQISRRAAHNRLQRHNPGDPNSIYDLPQYLLALGRGFSGYLTEIRSVRRQGALLQVAAAGSYGPRLSGEWELSLEPAPAYLVRSAKFTKPGSDAAILSTQSLGAAPGGGFAASGAFRRILKPDVVYEVAVQLQQYSPKPDAALLAEARKQLEMPLGEGDETLDYTVTPPRRTFADSKAGQKK